MKKHKIKKGIKVLEYLKGFLKYLEKNKKKELKVLANFENGFEAWLKVEFVSYCVNHLKYSSFETDVGIEYTASIKRGRKKQIDIWVKNGLESGNKLYHYIEMKYVIKDWHEKKQRKLWIEDFHTLEKISPLSKSEEEIVCPDEVASVLFGARFNAGEWNKFMADIKPKPIQEKVGTIKVAILHCSI